jgi:hypothetical protein
MLRVYHKRCIAKVMGHCTTEIGREWVQREAQEFLDHGVRDSSSDSLFK